MKRLKITLAISLSLLLAPVFANAADFKVINNTSQPLSFSINQVCADKLGIVNPKDVEILFSEQLTEACKAEAASCEVSVYNAAHCKGEEIAQVMLDISTGIKKVTVPSSAPYATLANGFYLTFEQPIIATK